MNSVVRVILTVATVAFGLATHPRRRVDQWIRASQSRYRRKYHRTGVGPGIHRDLIMAGIDP